MASPDDKPAEAASATPQAEAPRASPVGTARRPLLSAIAAILVIVSISALIFVARQNARVRDLREQYMRGAARAAEQVELNLKSYTILANTLGGLAIRSDGPLADTPEPPSQNTALSSARLRQIFVDSASSLALPSHRPALDRCASGAKLQGHDAVFRCQFAAIAELSSVGLTVEDCPGWVTTDSPAGPYLIGQHIVMPVARGMACASVPLGRLFGANLIETPAAGMRAHLGQADQAVLIDDRGRVLRHAAHPSPVRLRKLQLDGPAPLTDPDDHGSDDGGGQATDVRVRGSARRHIRVAGEAFDVFIQPATELSPVPTAATANTGEATAAKEADGSAALFVATLVSHERLEREGRQFSPRVFVWAVLLVSLSLLSLPGAKLWLLGPSARYGRFDAALLWTTSVFAALLTTVAGWTWYADQNLSSELDDRLANVLDKVEAALQAELVAAHAALEDFAGTEVERHRWLLQDARRDNHGATGQAHGMYVERPVPGPEPDGAFFEWNGYASRPAVVMFEGVQHGRYHPASQTGSSEDSATPASTDRPCVDFNASQDSPSIEGPYTLSLFSTLGDQLAKYTSREHATLPVNIDSRAYFKRASTAYVRRVEGKIPLRTPCKKVTSVRTQAIVRARTTGKHVLVAARGAPELEWEVCEDTDNDKPGTRGNEWRSSGDPERVPVLSVVTHMSRIEQLVLPDAFSVALVQWDGKTLYHSGKGGGVKHGYNILDDVDEAEQLRALLRLGSAGDLTTDYLGVRSHLKVHPLKRQAGGPDWFLVAMAPLDQIDRMTTYMATVAVTGWVLVALGLTCLTGIVLCGLLLRPRVVAKDPAPPAPPFVRPQLPLRRRYLDAAMLCAAGGLTTCVLGGLVGSALFVWGLIALTFLLQWALIRDWRWWRRASAELARLAKPLLGLSVAMAGRPSIPESRPGGVSLEASFTAWLVGLAMLLVATPATLLFAGAHAHELRRHEAERTSYLSRVFSDRPACASLLGHAGERRCPTSGGMACDVLLEHLREPEQGRTAARGREPAPAHYAGFAVSDLAFDLLLGLTRTSDADRADYRNTRSSWLIRPAWSTVGLLLAYLGMVMLAFGAGLLSVRKLFFTTVLTREQERPPVSLQRLPWPPGSAGQQSLVTTTTSALVQLTRCDFRYAELTPDAAVPTSGNLYLIPDLVGFVRTKQGCRLLRTALYNGASLLIFCRQQLRELRFASDGPWLEARLRGLSRLHEPDGTQPELQPPRFVVYHPDPSDLASYVHCKRFVHYPKEPEPGQALLIPNLEALVGDPQGIERLRIMVQKDHAIVAFSHAAIHPVHYPAGASVQDARTAPLSGLLARFQEVRGPARRDPYLWGYESPTTEYLASIWESANVAERCVLAQLAHFGFVTPHRQWSAAVDGLTSRGVLDPKSLTITPRLAAHIRGRTSPRTAQPEGSPERSAWNSLRAPLGATVAVICTAFGIGEPDVVRGSIFAPSLIAAIPIAIRMVLGLARDDDHGT